MYDKKKPITYRTNHRFVNQVKDFATGRKTSHFLLPVKHGSTCTIDTVGGTTD